MDSEALQQEINALIALLGDDPTIAKPVTERAVLEKIRLILEQTRSQRTGPARAVWEGYLPYAARLCDQLSRLEEGWENELDTFASENAQFWLDNASALLEQGDIAGVNNALGQILEAARLVKQDMVLRVDVLLQALEIALEISERKRSIQLYEEAEKVYRRSLAGGERYTGTAWLPKIKKMGQQLARYRETLRRYYQHAETVTFTIAADTERDLERVIESLQQRLGDKVKLTRRVKEGDRQGKSGRFQARLKIVLE